MRRRPDRILDVLDHTGADIAVLQEADKRLAPRPAALPKGMIWASGWHIVPLAQSNASLGWHGNAMLIRPGLAVTHVARLPLPGLEPRGAVLADLETPIGPLRVIGTHLGLVRRYRLMQLHEIIETYADLPPMPTLLAGDLNEWRQDTPLLPHHSPLRMHIPGPSFPAARPLGPLDRFATCPRLSVRATGVHAARPAHIASDHRPVWIDLSPARAAT